MKLREYKVLFAIILLGLTMATFASAALVNCGGYNLDGTKQAECGIIDLVKTIRLIINYLLSWAWLVSVLSIVWSGLSMMTARGNEETISAAKTGLENSLIGFIIIMAAFVILNLVIGLITGGGNINPGVLKDSFHLIS